MKCNSVRAGAGGYFGGGGVVASRAGCTLWGCLLISLGVGASLSSGVRCGERATGP